MTGDVERGRTAVLADWAVRVGVVPIMTSNEWSRPSGTGDRGRRLGACPPQAWAAGDEGDEGDDSRCSKLGSGRIRPASDVDGMETRKT